MSNATVVIPVVFHVLYKTAPQNVSESAIAAQLQVLRDDFRRTNADTVNTRPEFKGVAADMLIDFCFASVDPLGNPTSGITRTNTSIDTFRGDDAEKFSVLGGVDAWPANRYLNIWICNLHPDSALAYSTLPGAPDSIDGVTIGYRTLPGSSYIPYNKGRVATHEVGHWLNLYHPWHNGCVGNSDWVNDTPTQDSVIFDCDYDTFRCGFLSQVENFMQYTDDGCKNMFTLGQRYRMAAILVPTGIRESLNNAPTNLVSNVTSAQVNLSWDSVPGTVGCTVTLTNPCGGKITRPSISTTGHTIPLPSKIPPNWLQGPWLWKVRCKFATAGSCPTAYSAESSFNMASAKAAEVDSAVCCTSDLPPDNTNAYVSASGVDLSWGVVPSSIGCQVRVRTPSGATVTRNIPGIEQTDYQIPISQINEEGTYAWSVRCACTKVPLDMTGFSEEATFTIGCPTSVTDVDGNTYPVVRVGDLCWMAENLKVTRMPDETPIASIAPPWTSIDIPLMYDVAGATIPVGLGGGTVPADPLWGKVYNYAAASNMEGYSSEFPSGIQGICPDNWHLPSIAELNDLFSNGGGSGGLKSSNSLYWDNVSSHTNSSGFSAIGCGYFLSSGWYQNYRRVTRFRSASLPSVANSKLQLGTNGAPTFINGSIYDMTSVRCALGPTVAFPGTLAPFKSHTTGGELGAVLFPNPAEKVLEIRVTRSGLAIEVLLMDAMGRAVKSNRMTNGQLRLDVSDLPAGFYLVKLITDKDREFHAVVIK